MFWSNRKCSSLITIIIFVFIFKTSRYTNYIFTYTDIEKLLQSKYVYPNNKFKKSPYSQIKLPVANNLNPHGDYYCVHLGKYRTDNFSNCCTTTFHWLSAWLSRISNFLVQISKTAFNSIIMHAVGADCNVLKSEKKVQFWGNLTVCLEG